MNNITLTTDTKDLPIVYGLIDYGAVTEPALNSLKYIYTDICDIKKRYITLGFHLNEFNTNEYYKDFGFDTFKEFCEKNIPLEKSSINRCINVWYRFCCKNGNTPTIYLDDKYNEYDYSQLQEMVSMDDSDLKLVKPEHTVKEIRAIKKGVHIKPELIEKLIEYVHDKSKLFTRKNVFDKMVKKGKSWSSGAGMGFTFSFRPGKVCINGSKYYSFEAILAAYENNGGKFETDTVDSSQAKYLSLNEMCNKSGIVLYNYIKNVSAVNSDVVVQVFNSKGAQVNMCKCDILLTDSNNLVLRVKDDDDTGSI